ncbi:GNAT family N-acetyltransferase [Mycobacterium sp. WUMAC-067]|uniref:GNAT family N-acetyltransferase n=1 Tax=unclassified Mycobacterium TaxID=2642494 RepID=UPI001CD9A468|nr:MULTISPECIES: GNAT family N-acetyltransferase [unclassified Mycobacterium]MCA2242925.1 GNAT family N-acetyltransferase [Mycobacterium sp. WUMAC-067]MCA2316816.1 GNAT family N-acetyltransferase [Mycobacterium sp. WUMAC-025]
MESLIRTVQVSAAGSADAVELASVAAQTFPLACPPGAAQENIAAFVDANLSAERFADYLADPHRAVLAAARDGRIIGYAMLIRDSGADAAELSKIYVLPEYHGGGVSTALMDRALATAGEWGARRVWLGVNRANQRAQRFYAKSGFRISGTRTFQLGADLEHDYVMVRELG